MKRRPKVGIALGSGSARGLAYIGILQVLEENNIPIDYVAGSSIGALIGALYCSGVSLESIKKFFAEINWRQMGDFEIPTEGLAHGGKAEAYLASRIENKNFNQLKIPLSIVAADLNSGKEIVFTKGNVSRAVHASASVPVLFSPVKIGKMSLVDGGVVNPAPVDIVKKMGADIVIGINIGISPKKARFTEKEKEEEVWQEIKTEYLKKMKRLIERRYFLKDSYLRRKVLRPLFRKIFQPERIINFIAGKRTPKILEIVDVSNLIILNKFIEEKLRANHVDVIISPKLQMDYIEFNKMDHCIKEGRKATLKVLPALKKKMGKFR